MNKFTEFDQIKTPEDWKNINQLEIRTRQNSFIFTKLGFVFVCIMLYLSSIGLVYATRKDFRTWIHEQFLTEEIEEVPLPKQEETSKKELNFCIDDIFMYTYYIKNDETVIKDVSVFENGQFVLKDISHINGIYDNQEYSFNYVRYENRIFTFQEKGFILSVLPLVKEDTLYFNSSDNDLCTLNLKTNEVTKITNDHESVNSKISPDMTYITINKSDKYWTVYNTKTQNEKKLEALDPYAHSEEYDFFNNQYIIYYDEDSKTCLINLETNTITKLHEECLYPKISTISLKFKNQQTIIKDEYTKKEYKIDEDYSQYHYTVFKNRYIVFESFQDKKIIVADFQNKSHKILDYKREEENIDINFMDNEKYLVISNSKETYMISIEKIFGE